MPHPVPVQSLEASSGHGRPVGGCAQRGVIVSLPHGPWVGGGPGSQKAVSVSLQDFTEDVNSAFEFLLKLTPLLDKADQRCKYEVPCSPHCAGGVLALPLLFVPDQHRGPAPRSSSRQGQEAAAPWLPSAQAPLPPLRHSKCSSP